MPELLPVSLYIHYPWCIRKCPYCDFNSRAKPAGLDETYVQTLLADYRRVRAYLEGRRLRSVYLGGGTPSLLPLEQLAKLLEEILPDCADEAEISLEVNPGTVSLAALKAYRTLGINRLSLGVQSFADETLRRLGRIYDGSTARSACELVKEAGFANCNFDLMHGTPLQTVDSALADLRTALSFEPEHLSWYELTIEEGTPFARHPPHLPDEDTLFSLEEQGQNYLKEQGFIRYEVSGYARSLDRRCRHNLNYWYFGDYLGIGAGAHSKLFWQGTTLRRACPEDPLVYLKEQGEYRAVEAAGLPFEYLLNRLRVFGPVALEDFTRCTALESELIMPGLMRAQELGLVRLAPDFTELELTDLGKTMLNDILMLFLP